MDWKTRIRNIHSWTWEEAEDSTSPAKIWERFEKQVAPKVNHGLARYKLQQLRQKNDEFVDVFLTRCQNQATRCQFRDKDESDERLIEQLIVGTKHKKVQERLLEKGEHLTLDEAIDIARTYKATQSQMEELDGESNKDIHGIKGVENQNENKTKKCRNCRLDHPLQPRKKCPAYGSVCLNCQREITGQGFAAPEAKVEHVAGKGTEKTLSRLITPVVKTNATDEDPQVENVEMEIEET